MKTAQPRCTGLSVLVVAALVLLICAPFLAPKSALAQTPHDVYIEVATASSGLNIGYALGSYGSVSPEGFTIGRVQASLTRLVWNSTNEKFTVLFSSRPPYPLTSVQVEGDTEFDCDATSTLDYQCSTDGEDAPWAKDETRTIKLTFTEPEPPAPLPSPVRPFPTQAPATDEIPAVYGERDTSKDFSLTSVNADPADIWSDGTTMWVLDKTDQKVYAYTLSSGDRDTDKEFDLPADSLRSYQGITGVSSAGRLYISTDSITPNRPARIRVFDYSLDGAGNIVVAAAQPAFIQPSGTVTYDWLTTQITIDVDSLILHGIQRRVATYGQFSIPVSTSASNVTSTFSTFGLLKESGIFHDGNRLWVYTSSGGTGDVAPVAGSGPGAESLPIDYDTDGSGMWGNHETLWLVDSGSPIPIVKAHHFDPRLNISRARREASLAQTAPIVQQALFGQSYEIGDAPVIDLDIFWRHTSRLQEASSSSATVTRIEYEYDSTTTGPVGPVLVSPYPATTTIHALPRANYSLNIRVRYKWYNPGATEISINNPPGSVLCTEEDEVDYNTPGCAFRIPGGETRLSGWSGIYSVLISGPLFPVPDALAGKEGPQYHGVTSAVAEGLIIIGVSPGDSMGLGGTLTIIGWLGLSLALGTLAFFGSGASGVSVYLGTFITLIIWAGLGPVIANIPWPMAYLPAALLIMALGLFAIKKVGV